MQHIHTTDWVKTTGWSDGRYCIASDQLEKQKETRGMGLNDPMVRSQRWCTKHIYFVNLIVRFPIYIEKPIWSKMRCEAWEYEIQDGFVGTSFLLHNCIRENIYRKFPIQDVVRHENYSSEDVPKLMKIYHEKIWCSTFTSCWSNNSINPMGYLASLAYTKLLDVHVSIGDQDSLITHFKPPKCLK